MVFQPDSAAVPRRQVLRVLGFSGVGVYVLLDLSVMGLGFGDWGFGVNLGLGLKGSLERQFSNMAKASTSTLNATQQDRINKWQAQILDPQPKS